MIRMRRWSVFILAAAFVPPLQAQDKASSEKPASPWGVDRALTVSPQSAPVPALQYRLLPSSSDLKEGNAAPIYLRLAHEQSDAARKYWTEAPKKWNELPADKIPLEEARKFLSDHRYMLRQIEIGARRRTVNWDYTLDEPNPIGLLLPDLQWMRNYLPMVILQARVALAEGDFPAAAHHLETGFAFSRHVAEGPTLIHKMVAFNMAWQLTGAVADFIEQPHAPNLYWALAALPRPLIDPRNSFEWEYRMLDYQFPELADLDRERTAEQWDGVLRRVRTELRQLAMLATEHGERKLPDWFPKDASPEEPASKSPELPAAREYVARARGLSAEKVEALPASQVLLLYMVGTYRADRDDFFKGVYLPYPQAMPIVEAAVKRLRERPTSEARILSLIFLPGLQRVVAVEARLERNLAALRIIEALRLHAAAHDGKLPSKLAGITEVPVPNDPGTGRSFEYQLDDATATLISQAPSAEKARNGIRYRVTIRK
jgi:hypothetical protein